MTPVGEATYAISLGVLAPWGPVSALLERIVAPIASPADATATGQAIARLDPGHVVAIHVIEKAGGSIDKASVEQREVAAKEAFSAFREALGKDVETDLRYDTDVTSAIFAAAADHEATAIVFTPRGGSRWVQLLTGDVALDLITETDRPVIVLPDSEEANQ
ncbi:MAG: universal stress protein [Salinirussus sp.]